MSAERAAGGIIDLPAKQPEGAASRQKTLPLATSRLHAGGLWTHNLHRDDQLAIGMLVCGIPV